jgi:hypothetical protein
MWTLHPPSQIQQFSERPETKSSILPKILSLLMNAFHVYLQDGFQRAEHGHALEGRREIDLDLLALGSVRMVFDLVRAVDGLDHARQKLLGDVDQVAVVGVGHVELASGELGVVREVNALVAELPADLVDAVEAAHDEHLQVQLRRDSHEQVHVEVVVMCDEGLGSGATCDHVHHRRLYLQEAELVEELADVRDDLGAHVKDVAHAVIENQIQVAHAEAGLLVLETEMQVRKHVEAWRQQRDLGEGAKRALYQFLSLL